MEDGGLVLNICSDDAEPIDIDALLRGEYPGQDKQHAIEADSDSDSEGQPVDDKSEKRPSPVKPPPKPTVKKAAPQKKSLNEVLYERGISAINKKFEKPKPKFDKFHVDVELPPAATAEESQPRGEVKLFTDDGFSELEIHPHLVGCLRDRMKIDKATVIQKMSVKHILERNDMLIKSPTGSGKTLAYALPIFHLLMTETPKIKRESGTRAVIITPTRELALQTYQCFELLSKACQWIVPGVLMGGEKKKSEKARLRKGIVVMVGTPGRLIDHLDHTSTFSFGTADWLIIDEADRMLEMGFEQSISRVIESWKKERGGKPSNAILLSATLTPGVEKLAGLSLNEPVVVDATHECQAALDDFTLPESLEQTFMVCPTKLYLIALSSLVVRGAIQKDKIVVFLPTQGVVDFYLNLFSGIMAEALLDSGYKVNFYRLHGTMSQHDRTEVFTQFRGRESGVLFTTDVASRGLDLPKVDLIVQFSLPLGVQDYVHRVGRTARIGTKGRAVLLLMPCQAKYLNLLAKSKLRPEQMQMRGVINYIKTLKDYITRKNPSFGLRSPEDYCTALQLTFEAEVKKEPELLECARNAFSTYIRSAASYPLELREVAPFKELHLGHVAKMFCLNDPPRLLGQKAPKHIRNENKSRYSNSKAARPFAPAMKRKEISEWDSGMEPSKKQKRALKG